MSYLNWRMEISYIAFLMMMNQSVLGAGNDIDSYIWYINCVFPLVWNDVTIKSFNVSKEITLTVVTEAGITWITSISLIFSVLLFISLCSCCCYCCWCCLSPRPPKPTKRSPQLKPRSLTPSPGGPNSCNDRNSTPSAITVQSEDLQSLESLTPTLNQKWFFLHVNL